MKKPETKRLLKKGLSLFRFLPFYTDCLKSRKDSRIWSTKNTICMVMRSQSGQLCQKVNLSFLSYVSDIFYSGRSANIDICFESGIPLDQVHLQARQRIQMSFFSVSIMGDAVNLSPSWELQRAALDVGSSVYLWSMNTSRAFVLHGQTVNMVRRHSTCLLQLRHYHRQRFINQINPLRTSLRAAVEPALIPGRLEPEYAEYALRACLAETGRGDRPGRCGLLMLYSRDSYVSSIAFYSHSNRF